MSIYTRVGAGFEGSANASCDDGDVATGGGASATGSTLEASYPLQNETGPWGWAGFARGGGYVAVYVICADITK